MKAIRLQIQKAPLFLPLCGVVGAIAGSWWLLVPVIVLAAACFCRLWRISLCTLLCALIAGLHTMQVAEREREFCEQAAWQEVVELTGSVEQTLHRGFVISTGWTGVRVLLRGESPVTPGDVVWVRAAWREPVSAPVRGVFDSAAWMQGQGIAASLDLVECRKTGKPLSLRTVQHWGEEMRESLSRRLMPRGTEHDPARQVLCALVLGDKSGADTETLDGFRKGGCLHAFAVSGLHVGLVSGILWGLFRLLRLRPVVIRPLLLLTVGVYVLTTGCAVPAIRAYVMLAVVLLGYILQRRVSLLNTWSFAALIILLPYPHQLFNAGFILSFSIYATICLALRVCMQEKPWFGPDSYIPASLRTRWEMRCWQAEFAVRGTIIVSLSAWLASVPVTLYFFHTANSSSFLTNIAITPLLPLAMLCGLLHLVAGGIPWLGAASGWAAHKSATLLLGVVSWFGDLPHAWLPAQEPAAPHALLVQGTNFGGSFTILGNPGLLIDCGNKTTAEINTLPTLFHAGFTPAVLLVTRPQVSAGGGASVIQRMWPQMEICQAHELPAEGLVFETQAGRFTLYPPPPDFSCSRAESRAPIVLWETPARRVLYIGSAAYATYASLPFEARKADVVLLGRHPQMPVPAAALESGQVILLPGTPCRDDDPPGQRLPERGYLLLEPEEGKLFST